MYLIVDCDIFLRFDDGMKKEVNRWKQKLKCITVLMMHIDISFVDSIAVSYGIGVVMTLCGKLLRLLIVLKMDWW
jgi:hypothetical protein